MLVSQFADKTKGPIIPPIRPFCELPELLSSLLRLTKVAHSFLSKKKAIGALIDSLKMYFQRSSRLGEMGLVRVGDV